jgi:trehalose/maltose hydrolase-like predicted phosphorylase
VRYQTIVGATDPWVLSIVVDGVPMRPDSGVWLARTRSLDLRTGSVTTTGTWQAPGGTRVAVRTRRMAWLASSRLLWSELTLDALDGAVTVDVTLETRANTGSRTFPGEPEALTRAWGPIFRPAGVVERLDGPCALVHVTAQSGRAVACATEVVGAIAPTELTSDANTIRRRFRSPLRPGQPLSWTQRAAFADGAAHEALPLLDEASHAVSGVGGITFDDALDRQRGLLDVFWEAADVEIEGDPDLERAVRYSTFQIYQAAACPGDGWSPAKGLTGQGYEGHHLWEHEIYINQALSVLAPDAARGGLMFRCRTLPQARERARSLSHRGAQFPWRTIDGTEASAFFPAGAAQHHANADIAWAIEHYVECTGDASLLTDGGIDVLVETARFWMSLGRFDREGRFHIEGVTGPDEYTALVDDNLYTNLMASENLRAAADRVEELAAADPARFAAAEAELRLDAAELASWRRAAAAVVVAYDDDLQIHAQDATFLRLRRWDLDATPAEEFPLQDHHHLLTLYRHQVLKQADLVLAQFLLPHRFEATQRRRNFEYYEPLTTHDSSLSAAVHAVVAADVGRLDLARRYLEETATVDLADRAGNVSHGLHLAAAAGAWLAVACGFGGFRVRDGQASLRPQLPPGCRRLHFRLRFQGRLVDVDVDETACSYRVLRGGALTILHDDEPTLLRPDTPVRCSR